MKIALSVLFGLLSPLLAWSQHADVASFTPQGEVRRIQQVAIAFNRDMVRLGQGDAPTPIAIQCPQGGAEAPEGRWLDTRRYVLEWPRDLPIGTRCTVTLNPGVKTLDGADVRAAGPWTFTTGGPKLALSLPYNGESNLREQPVFLLRPDAQPDLGSVDRHLACQAEGAQPQRMQRLSREEGLREMRQRSSQFQEAQWDAQGWLAYRCERAFPNSAKVRLVWGASIAALSGVASRAEQIFNYSVRAPFTLNVTCAVMEDNAVCDPRTGAGFGLTWPVTPAEFVKIKVTTANGQTIAHLPFNHSNAVNNHATQPFETLQEGGRFTVTLSEPLYDTDGRVLANVREFPQTFTVAKLPPYLGFVPQASVLPLADKERAKLVIAARYVEPRLVAKAVRVSGAQAEAGEKAALALLRGARDWAAEGGRAYPVMARHGRGLKAIDLPLTTDGGAMNFHGLPLDKPGVWLVELDSARFRDARKPGQRPVQARASLVQVTNLNLTVRASARGDSLVWVTAIDTGQPVADADVAYYDCADNPVWRGKSGTDGVARLPMNATCGVEGRHGEYLVVRKGDDLAALQVGTGQFFPSPRGPAPFGGRAPVQPGSGQYVTGHTILDRTLFKAGETLHLENHVREQVSTGFQHLPPARGSLEIIFNFSEVVHKAEVRWNEHGAANATWRIPANAKLGRYIARIRAENGNSYDASFQVEEYRTPLFDAKLDGSAVWRGEKQELPVGMSLNYLSGGAAAGEAVSLRGRWSMGTPAPVPGFDFANRRIAPFAQQNEAPRALKLDDKGEARTSLAPPETPHAITLFAELQFSDPSGEVQTVAQRYPVWPYRNKVGVRTAILPDAGAGGPRGVELTGLVLDSMNKPLGGKRMQFSVARARAERGFHVLTSEDNPACDGTTGGNGEARCTWRPASLPAISYNEVWLITAQADGEKHVATTLLYDWQLRWTPSNTMLEIEGLNARDSTATLTPEKPAQLRVRAPFTPAMLLLTVAREGVLAHSVHAIDSADVRLPLDIKEHYAPNVQIGAAFVRPLVPAPDEITLHAQHVINARVTPAAYALRVTVTPAREEARPRERVPVTMHVRKNDGSAAPNARVTLIAVDDALLALGPNATWNLFAAMTRERSVAMQQHVLLSNGLARAKLGRQWDFRPGDEWVSLQMAEMAGSTIGIRGLDSARAAAASPPPAARPMAAPMAQAPGAGGATEPAVRSDFSTLALWRTEVVTDASGNAAVEVPMNDSLTRWRIVAVATHEADKFGTGEATLRTAQPLQVISGLPLSVRSGDALVQKVTLRNTTQQAITVELAARAQLTPAEGQPGNMGADPARGFAVTRNITLKPEENREVTWPVSVPDGIDRIRWTISAKGSDLSDAIEIEQAVTPAVPVTVRQATLLQVEKSVNVPVTRPAGARGTAGGVSVAWQASLGDAALVEVRKWMQGYPFICLEQKTSKLATLGDRDGWERLMRELPQYLDGSGLARYFPTHQLQGSEILTAYVLDTAAALQWEIPAAVKTRMLNALRAQLAGRTQGLDWAPQDASVARALSLQATLSEQAPGSLDKVVTPADMAALPTTALVDWVRYLLATPKAPQRVEALKEAANTLRARYDVQGTRLSWRNEARENWWWFMWNGNLAAARTAWVVNRWMSEDPSWKDDLPLLVTGLVGRQQNGHWGTTTANVWGSIALSDFARVREAERVSGTSNMRMTGASTQMSASVTWPTTATTALGWPVEKDAALTLSHTGTGAPWATVTVRAAVKLEQPVSQGLQVSRTITPVEQKSPGRWSVGDTARVTLTMSGSAALTWVVVRDPVPSGATILGRGLARESTLAQQGQQRSGAWPVFEERAADSYRGYYRYVPQGTWHVEYTVRINNAGTFEFPPARVEAMYAPEIFGETPVAAMTVNP